MAERIATVHVALIPSTIENAPNSLAEAMLLGTPCVASFVGGNADMLDGGRCGLMYAYDDAVMLAHAIDRIFASDELARNLSSAARETALARHDPATLTNTLTGIYETVIQKSVERRRDP
jgi:glycosyltransferase involved in cell wall biosynthesis